MNNIIKQESKNKMTTDFFNEEVNEELDKQNSGYFKFEEGDNLLRIVSGFAWGLKYDFKNSAEGKEKGYPFFRNDDPSIATFRSKLHLSASMVVYDYSAKELKTLSIHQKAILLALRKYSENVKYGVLTGYDITITKTVTSQGTRYPSTIADPKEELSAEIVEALKKVTINLDNAYENKPMIEEIV